jgi:phospholipid/cholesterol/gamma-HCH transport system ATP-binding protein
MSNQQNIVELHGVHKRFGRLEVLRGIDLFLERGKTTVVIGESGTGKSVLLKVMTGLLSPEHGEVFFNNHRIDLMSEKELMQIRQHFGFLFQMGALFDSLTAYDNIAFPLVEHTNYSDKQISQIVTEKLRLVGLDGVQRKLPAELSGGQRKRVALARAIAMEPEIVLYDEPTTGLDPIRADTINDLIIKLKHEIKVTSVVVTHDMTSAFKVGDRIIMLHEGHFIADGPPQAYRNADDPRVRQFVLGEAVQDRDNSPVKEVVHDQS